MDIIGQVQDIVGIQKIAQQSPNAVLVVKQCPRQGSMGTKQTQYVT